MGRGPEPLIINVSHVTELSDTMMALKARLKAQAQAQQQLHLQVVVDDIHVRSPNARCFRHVLM